MTLFVALAVIGVAVAWFVLAQFNARPWGTSGAAPALQLGEHLHSVQPMGRDALLFGTHGASAMSTDGGRTFRRVAALDGVDAMETAVGATGRMMVVAGHDGMRMSTDGESWVDLTARLPGPDVHGFGVDRGDPKHMVAYVVGSGVFESRDAGESWRRLADPPSEPMGDALVDGAAIVVPTMPSGLLRSNDDGAHWSTIAPEVSGMELQRDPRSPRTWYLSGASALFVSRDAGATWTTGSLPAGAQVAAPAADGTLYAAGYPDRTTKIWRSSDGGKTWKPSF